MKKALTCLLVLALTPIPTWASPGADQAHIEVIKKTVAHCVDHQRRVVVETYDKRRLQGVISEARTDDFVLIDAGRATTLSYKDIRKIKWQSPGLETRQGRSGRSRDYRSHLRLGRFAGRVKGLIRSLWPDVHDSRNAPRRSYSGDTWI